MKHLRETLVSLPSLICLGSLLLALDASGQATAPVRPNPPSGSLLGPAPAFAQWVVTFSYPQDREPKPTGAPAVTETRVRKITTTKTNNVIREETIGAQGDAREDWTIGLVQYAKLPSSNAWYCGLAGAAFPANGFRELDWVTMENYIGVTKLGEHNCLVFAPNAPASVFSHVLDPGTLESLVQVAYVDAESRLPVQVNEGGVIRFYQFVAPPTEMLTPPPDLAAELKKSDDLRARFNRSLEDTSNNN